MVRLGSRFPGFRANDRLAVNLRPYQTALLFDILAAFAGGARRVLAVLPTGGGKTICFSELAQADTDATAIVAHRRELIRQASGKLALPHGIIAPGYPQTSHRIQVASVQTIARRAHRDYGFIVLDEAHHAVAGQWRKFLDAQPAARVLGVTATPERLDGRGLGDMFDTLIVGPSVADLIADGYLSPVRVFAPPGADLSGVRTIAGDYDAQQVAEVMDRPALLGDAVLHYSRHADGQPAVAFCATVAHAEHTAAAFRAAGYRSACVHGGQDVSSRDAGIRGLGDGSIDVLTSCDLISEGTDIPAVGCVMLLHKSQSLGRIMQEIGRGFRPIYAPGHDLNTRAGRIAAIAASSKPWLTILDHAANLNQPGFGMPDAPRNWTLEGRIKRDRTAPALRRCPECYAVHPPAPRCPACSHEYTVERAAVRPPETADGDLIEVTRAALPALKEQLAAAATHDDVEAIRKARGYKPGWTRAVMAHRRFSARTPHTTAAEDFA